MCVYVCVCTLIDIMTGKRKYVEKTSGQKVDALQDLSNGMSMRTMENSKTVKLREFFQKK